ncbi:MAG: hypothetical protein ACOYEG_09505 [Petrimonas sp.]|jgi:CRP-like cAMP-binding protein
MEEKLINFISKIIMLSAEETQAITSSMTMKTFKESDNILRKGQHSNDTYFVLEGYIRQYKIINGNEVTTNLFRLGNKTRRTVMFALFMRYLFIVYFKYLAKNPIIAL